MSVALLAEAFETDLTGAPRMVLVVLAWHANAEADDLAWPSLATITTEANANRRTVQKALDVLEAGGFACLAAPAIPAESRPACYHVHPAKGWRCEAARGGGVRPPGGGGVRPPGWRCEAAGVAVWDPETGRYSIRSTKFNESEREIQIAFDETAMRRAAKRRRPEAPADDAGERFTRGRYGQFV